MNSDSVLVCFKNRNLSKLLHEVAGWVKESQLIDISDVKIIKRREIWTADVLYTYKKL